MTYRLLVGGQEPNCFSLVATRCPQHRLGISRGSKAGKKAVVPAITADGSFFQSGNLRTGVAI